MTNEKERRPLPDILRGFAIVLVVFGHCIQEGSGAAFRQDSLYFQDRVYQFIYSFHMPLFMLISGYLSWNGTHRAAEQTAWKERFPLLKKRAQALLLPILLWTVLDYLRIFIINLSRGYLDLSLDTILPSFIRVLPSFVISLLTNLWFLWAAFWCFLLVFIMHCYLRDSLLLYGIGFLLLFLIPDGLGLGAYKYMTPYFIGGFYFHKWQGQKWQGQERPMQGRANALFPSVRQFYQRFRWVCVALSGILFGLLFYLFFDENTLIYLSGYKLIGKDVPMQLVIDFYRMLIGFSGSLFFILLWQETLKCGYSFPVLTKLGKNSMGIYILSGYLLVLGIAPLTANVHPSYLLNLLECAIVLTFSNLLTELLSRLPFLRKLVGR
ncbi:MAG: acyltransferase [Blautia sp.]|nr:acyltransferase [Lachnoclostridium sp.]MCM1211358.1 acyltransferase [Blautia sp.]